MTLKEMEIPFVLTKLWFLLVLLYVAVVLTNQV